jgi:hypothetical protein
MDPHPFHRPSGSSVWTAKALAASSDWLFRLPDTALREIDERVAGLKARGAALDDIGAADFPLHSLDNQLKAMKDEISTGRGFVIIRGLEAARYTTDELRMIFWGLGCHFGTPMPQSFLGDRVGDVMDLSDEEPDPRKRRGYHSGGAQDTHTDSSDIVAMLSIRTAKSGGESRLASAHAVHNLMMDNCPGLLKVLYDGFYIRSTDTDAAAEGRPALSAHRVPAYMYTSGWLNSFYVRGYVERAVKAGDVVLSPEEAAAVVAFAAFGNHPDVVLSTMLEPGDMQIFNNRTILHGRAQFEDHPERERRRHLLRLWLSVPQWPRMSAVQDIHSDDVKLRWAEAARRRHHA